MPGQFGNKGRGFRPPRSEDDKINPQTRRPYWDSTAMNQKSPGQSPMISKFVKQRKAAGTKGY